MIDFQNAKFVKLRPVADRAFADRIAPMLTAGETLFGTFKGVRDGIVFTSKRIITLNVQGLTGKKVDYTSLPYKRIQAYSVETAGVLDLDSELTLWFSGMGMLKIDFASKVNIGELCRLISEQVL